MTLERNLARRVREWLKTQPDVWSLKTAGGARQRRGVPDVLGCVGGRFFAVELKTEDGRLSASQSVEIAAIEKAGGRAAVCRSLGEVRALIELLRRA